jgi:hypothetical protein
MIHVHLIYLRWVRSQNFAMKSTCRFAYEWKN